MDKEDVSKMGDLLAVYGVVLGVAGLATKAMVGVYNYFKSVGLGRFPHQEEKEEKEPWWAPMIVAYLREDERKRVASESDKSDEK